MMRSLRWRLVFAMALIIGAVVIAAGLLSTITVKYQFDRYLIAQRRESAREASRIMASATVQTLDQAMRRVHARFGSRSIAVDDAGKVVARYPADLDRYEVTLLAGGGLELTRMREGRIEAIRVLGASYRVAGVGTVYLLPPAEGERGRSPAFRVAPDRWLVGSLSAAALLAALVMLTIFRRVFRPVEKLTEGARALASGRLETRVDVRGDDEVAELGRAFNTMAEALERNETARRNMVSDVAHELRTPLTSIRVQLEAAQDGVVEADAKWIASIADDAATLARLVDDLQQLSLAEAGQLRLEFADVAVSEIVDRALSGLDARGLTIVRDVDPQLVVHADARRLVQVVRNLVVNAVAYAKSTIEVRAAREGVVIAIRVADDGPGVPDEHAERIFDRFYRADPSRSRATGGAGLGLAIARQLVELHGGTIRYERPAFVVRLPFINS